MTIEPGTDTPGSDAIRDGARPATYPRLAFVWAVCAAVVLLWLHDASLLPQAPDKWTYDLRTALLSERAAEQRKDIVVVLVGEDSLAGYKYRSPVDRGMMAALVGALEDAGAKVIGLDFLFDRPTETVKDDALVAAIRNTTRSRVALAAIDKSVWRASPAHFKYQDEFLRRAGKPVGHAYFQHEDDRWTAGDRIVRYHTPEKLAEFPAETGLAKRCRASFARLIYNEAAGRTIRPKCAAAPDEATFIDILHKRPARRGSYIAWRLPPVVGSKAFASFHVRKHREGVDKGEILTAAHRTLVKGRIVLVGGDFIDRDGHLTPLSVLDGETRQGIWIHAQVLAQLIDGRSLDDLPRWIEFVGLIVVGWFGFWLSRRYRFKRYGMLVSILGIGVLGLIAAILFSQMKIMMPTATFFFAWLAGVWFGHFCGLVVRGLRIAR